MTAYFSSILYSIFLGFFEVFPLSGAGLDTLLTALFKEALPPVGSSWIWGTLLGTLLLACKPLLATAKGLCSMVTGMVKGTFRWRKASRYQIMGVYSLLGALPLVVMLLVLQATGIGSGLGFMGFMFLASAALLFIGDHTVCQEIPFTEMTATHGIKAALFQAVSLLPGLSRIGVTFGTTLNMGFKRQEAAEFTMILSVPALLVLGLWNLPTFHAAGWICAFGGLLGAALAAALGGRLLLWLFKKDLLNIAVFSGAACGVATIIISLFR